jgi:hypothetical protein
MTPYASSPTGSRQARFAGDAFGCVALAVIAATVFKSGLHN